MQGKLTLSDGTVFLGESFGSEVNTSGEVVFNTGMVGYPESFTDPSYFGQILVLTYPLAGNYGVPKKEFWESQRVQVKGVIVQNYIENPSHFESEETLGSWLREQQVPALFGIDTRELTRKLREHGVMLGKIEINKLEKEIYDPNSENVLPKVSTENVEEFGDNGQKDHPKKNIVLIDCGAKENITRSLVRRGVKVTKVPWNFDVLKSDIKFDGVLISNGPGDPTQAKETIKNVKQLLDKNIPTFGICLGSQILALAAGGSTYKLKFGHRGQNQPILNPKTNKAIITSQNHGFAVDMKSLGKDWEEWFINLNDGTNEGLRHKTKPFMAVQFHPEANPGPFDGGFLFEEFINLL
jgi:carbamoyl-phosphate synthase small subunit